MHQDFNAVSEVIQTYFDGLYHSDTNRLRQVFHPKAIYACASEGALLHLTMDDYFPIIDKRPAPASQGEPRRDEIVSIDFAGPVTALVRAHCAIGPKYFTDLLTLTKTDNRWQIIAKVFHFDLIQPD